MSGALFVLSRLAGDRSALIGLLLVVALVFGLASVGFSAGMNLALGCDLIVASEQARFSEIFARRGLTIGLVLTITLVAFEALAVATVDPAVGAVLLNSVGSPLSATKVRTIRGQRRPPERLPCARKCSPRVGTRGALRQVMASVIARDV